METSDKPNLITSATAIKDAIAGNLGSILKIGAFAVVGIVLLTGGVAGLVGAMTTFITSMASSIAGISSAITSAGIPGILSGAATAGAAGAAARGIIDKNKEKTVDQNKDKGKTDTTKPLEIYGEGSVPFKIDSGKSLMMGDKKIATFKNDGGKWTYSTPQNAKETEITNEGNIEIEIGGEKYNFLTRFAQFSVKVNEEWVSTYYDFRTPYQKILEESKYSI